MSRLFASPGALLLLLTGGLIVNADARTRPNPDGRVILDPSTPTRSAPGEVSRSRSGSAVPLPGGAILLGSTYYDLQDMGSLGRHVEVGPDGTVTVTYQDGFCELDDTQDCPPSESAPNPFPERAMALVRRTPGGTWGSPHKVNDPDLWGCCLTERFGGFGALGLTPDGRPVVAQHMNEDGCDLRGVLYVEDTFGSATYQGYLGQITSPSYLFPQPAIGPTGQMTMLGELPIAGSYDEVEEFRIGVLAAEGPAFTCPTGWQFTNWTSVVDDALFRDGFPAFPSIAAGSDGRVGIAVSDFGGDVFLIESSNGTFAAGTITVTNLTSYDDADITDGTSASGQYRAFIHSSIVYAGTTPQVVWSEIQARRDSFGIFYVDYRSRIRHWSPDDGVSTVYRTPAGVADTYSAVDEGGSGPLAGFNTLSVDWPQVGVSPDGAFSYVIWLRFVDDEVDASADMGLPGLVTGVGYGDVAASYREVGSGWSAATNLTSTPTTDERFASISSVNPDGTVHVTFQASATDEAGVVVIGDRGAGGTFLERRIGYLEHQLHDIVSADGPSVVIPAGFSVRPNPSRGAVRFETTNADRNDRIGIFDAAGRRVDVIEVPRGRGASRPWSGAPGVYFARSLVTPAAEVVRFTLVR